MCNPSAARLPTIGAVSLTLLSLGLVLCPLSLALLVAAGVLIHHPLVARGAVQAIPMLLRFTQPLFSSSNNSNRKDFLAGPTTEIALPLPNLRLPHFLLTGQADDAFQRQGHHVRLEVLHWLGLCAPNALHIHSF